MTGHCKAGGRRKGEGGINENSKTKLRNIANVNRKLRWDFNWVKIKGYI